MALNIRGIGMSSGRQNMSGRGTMIWLTRTSPKVRRFWMKSRSRAAIMPPS